MELKFNKGFFFTSIAVLIISFLMLTIKPLPTTLEIEKLPIIESRVTNVNEYVARLNYDFIPKAFVVSSKNALINYSKHVIAGNSFSEDLDYLSNFIYRYMTDTGEFSLKNLLNNITILANDSLSVKTEFNFSSNDNFVVFQNDETGPWKVGFNYTFNYTITSDLAIWNITDKKFTIFINIDDLPDPYYFRNTNNVKRNITPSIYIDWNITRLIEHVNDKTYAWSNISPNYLSRLINTSEASECCGIHTFISENDISGGELHDYNNRSFVDFCHFDEDNCEGDLFKIDGISTDFDNGDIAYPFRLDTHHIAMYRISDEYFKIDTN